MTHPPQNPDQSPVFHLVFEGDDGVFFLNQYRPSPCHRLIYRTTLLDGMTRSEALRACREFDRVEKRRFDLMRRYRRFRFDLTEEEMERAEAEKKSKQGKGGITRG